MGSDTKISKDIDDIFDDVQDGEIILIQTANSAYEFSVTDARQRRGLLSGGQLGLGQFKAFLAALPKEGHTARFLVRLDTCFCRMATSEVKEIRRLREDERSSCKVTQI